MGLAVAIGWSWQSGLILGIAVSVASTVVMLRALLDHGIVETRRRTHRDRLAGGAGHRHGSRARAGAGCGWRRWRVEYRPHRCDRAGEARVARRDHDARRRAIRSVAALARGTAALRGAVHARGAGDGDLRGDGLLRGVWRFHGAGRVPRRHGRRAIEGERSGRRRCSADAQCLCRALLRLGRDVVRLARGDCGAGAAHRRSRHHSFGYAITRLPHRDR